jgi:hypothetical protein
MGKIALAIDLTNMGPGLSTTPLGVTRLFHKHAVMSVAHPL